MELKHVIKSIPQSWIPVWKCFWGSQSHVFEIFTFFSVGACPAFINYYLQNDFELDDLTSYSRSTFSLLGRTLVTGRAKWLVPYRAGYRATSLTVLSVSRR